MKERFKSREEVEKFFKESLDNWEIKGYGFPEEIFMTWENDNHMNVHANVDELKSAGILIKLVARFVSGTIWELSPFKGVSMGIHDGKCEHEDEETIQ